LDEVVVSRLREGTTDKTWLAVPEVIDWDDFGGIKYAGFRYREKLDDVYMPQFLEICPDRANLKIADLKRWQVKYLDAATDQERDHWSVHQCLYAEVQEGDDVYATRKEEP
jgi:uncharacterized protein (TIGR04141 family)